MQLPPFKPVTEGAERLSLDELLQKANEEEKAGFQESIFFQQASSIIDALGPGDCDPFHWAKMAYWTSDEVAALSLGKNPTIVNVASCQEAVNRYQVCRDFLERRELVLRAIDAGQIFERTVPSHAMAWLERFQISHPQALRDAIEQLGHQVADWKTLYDSVVERAVELEQELELADLRIQTQQQRDAQHAEMQAWTEQALGVLSTQAELIDTKEAQVADLQYQLEELKQSVVKSKDEELGTRERDSLLKLVLAMAVEQYGYLPDEAKSAATSAILEDLVSNGIELSDDTVRKYLKEAAEKHWNRETE